MINTILALLSLAVTIFLVLPLFLYLAFPKLMRPSVFYDVDGGFYGIRKASRLRNIVCFYGLIVSGLIDGFRAFNYRRKGNKGEPAPVLYQRVIAKRFVTDPRNTGVKLQSDGKPTPGTREKADAYLGERAAVLAAMIDQLGWRRVFIRFTAEMPQPEVNKEGQRLSVFAVY